MWLALMLPSSKQSLMKRYLIQMCLLLSWENRFLARARAELLSTFNSTTSTFLPSSSPSSLDSHRACVTAGGGGDVLCLAA